MSFTETTDKTLLLSLFIFIKSNSKWLIQRCCAWWEHELTTSHLVCPSMSLSSCFLYSLLSSTPLADRLCYFLTDWFTTSELTRWISILLSCFQVHFSRSNNEIEENKKSSNKDSLFSVVWVITALLQFFLHVPWQLDLSVNLVYRIQSCHWLCSVSWCHYGSIVVPTTELHWTLKPSNDVHWLTPCSPADKVQESSLPCKYRNSTHQTNFGEAGACWYRIKLVE